MAKDKLTAEEQLLNLIEDGQGPNPIKLKRKKSSWLNYFSFSQVGIFFGFLIKALKDLVILLRDNIRDPDLKVWNKVLAVLVTIAFIYLTADFIFHRLDVSQIIKKVAKANVRDFKEVPPPQTQPFLYYLEMVQRRDIFAPVRFKTLENPDDEAKKALAAQVKNYKLVGISWGESPQVIIEDGKDNKTYFLKAGDTIGQFKVNSILKDKVILESDGQKLELM